MPRLVAFDVDGTLLRGETICECLARNIGRAEEMRRFEAYRERSDIAAARRTMLDWYRPHGRDGLLRHLGQLRIAPGARAGFAALRARGIRTALVSITWKFAVDWLAAELGADDTIGTGWLETDAVADVWPEDKAAWLTARLGELGLSARQLVAVGDSWGDVPMLKLAARGYFVGAQMPEPMPHVLHRPGGDIGTIVAEILTD